MFWDFAGGPEVKNLPVSAEDLGSIPGPGRSHLSWGNSASAPELRSRQAAIKTQYSKQNKQNKTCKYICTHIPICSYMEQYQRLAKQSAEQYNSMLLFVSKPCEMKYIESYIHIY